MTINLAQSRLGLSLTCVDLLEMDKYHLMIRIEFDIQTTMTLS